MVLTEDSVESEICRILESQRDALRGHRVLLFGSRAEGRAERRSDFDLAVDGSSPLDLESFYDIQDALERIPTLYPMDWLDLHRASTKVANNARRHGRVLYEG